jgi:hypothetical protein
MFGQNQQVGNGAVAIQAKGDVTISQGMTPDQMTQIMVGLAKQLALYQSDAETKVEERLNRVYLEKRSFSSSELSRSLTQRRSATV